MSLSGPSQRALVDQRGCLTPAGFEVLARAPVGRGPAELAAHVASCPRCQERMLAGAAGARPSSTASRRRKPRLWIGVGLAVVAFVLAVAALILAARLR